MRKTILLLSAFLMLSCSGSDDSENTNNSNVRLNPPEWIRGTWLLENSEVQSGFSFYSDDVCIISIGMSACNKANLQQADASGIETNVKERITEQEYEVEITIGSNTTEYEFEKTIDGDIMWVNVGSNPVYVKQ